MTIDLGEFALAIVTFLIGTLIPIIYRRFSYEGISIRQPFAVDALFSDNKTNDHVFATVLKIANAHKESALVDDIRLELPTKKGVRVHVSDIKIRVYNSGDLIYAPIDIPVQIKETGQEERNVEYHFPDNTSYAVFSQPTNLTYLPLIIRPDEEKLVAVQFTMPEHLNREVSHGDLYVEKEKKWTRILFRINGKYRGYTVHLRRPSGDQ